MNTTEERIIHIVRENGNILDISNLAFQYEKIFGDKLPKSKKISKWVGKFNSLAVIPLVANSARFVCLQEFYQHLRELLVSKGAIEVNNVPHMYKHTTKETFPIPPKIKLVPWLESIDIINVFNNPNGSKSICLKSISLGGGSDNQVQHNHLISSVDELKRLLSHNNNDSKIADEEFSLGIASNAICIHCETLTDDTHLFAIRDSHFCALIDCSLLEKSICSDVICEYIKQSGKICILHNIYNHRTLLDVRLADLLLDSQLVMESLTGNYASTLVELALYFKTPTKLEKSEIGDSSPNRPFTLKNPIIKQMLQNIEVLIEIGQVLSDYVDKTKVSVLIEASTQRQKSHGMDLRFIIDEEYKVSSNELAQCLYPQESISQCNKLEFHNDVDAVLDLLPNSMQKELEGLGTAHISDLSLDLKRRPHCWLKGQRKWLSTNCDRNNSDVVQKLDLEEILRKVGHIGSDNRCGLEGSLHRISCLKNRSDKVIGVTIRFGRHISGNVDMIKDILCGPGQNSILFLGEPGSGKTTIVREAIKHMAESQNLFVVDTSNEIAGDGDLPHECIGDARRLMVGSLEDQANVMIECVQNHTPTIMVIDEIGRTAEVAAAKTSKNRGVRMIASAHGDLRSLLKNRDLRGLVGGIETITIGDETAKEEAKKKGLSKMNKQKTQRSGAPIFEIIVEVKRGMHNEWTIIKNSGKAVDDILDGQKYDVERRIRNPGTGTFFFKMDKL